MARLLSVVTAGSDLGASLKSHAEDPAFAQLERAAFGSDAYIVDSATRAMSQYPAFGFDAPSYDNALSRIAEAREASDAATPADPPSIHSPHLHASGAVAAMRAVTTKPAAE